MADEKKDIKEEKPRLSNKGLDEVTGGLEIAVSIDPSLIDKKSIDKENKGWWID